MTTLKQIGEFGLIEKFRKLISTDSSVIKGSGDDCAVVQYDATKYMLLTCDVIVEGVDFLYSHKPELIGRKALAISISDIASCGGLPRYCLVSLVLPKNITLRKIMRLSKGLFDLAREYKINVVGGDVSRGPSLAIDVSMVGFVDKKRLVLRSGAKVGDIIFTTGKLGGSIRGKHLKFIPRLKEAQFLTGKYRVNAMIDISDGLTQDLGHILEDSNAGAVIYQDLVPVSYEARGIKEALYMGEDFELLFTLSRKEAMKLMRDITYDFKPIGEIMDKKFGFTLIDSRGRVKPVKPKGFRHF